MLSNQIKNLAPMLSLYRYKLIWGKFLNILPPRKSKKKCQELDICGQGKLFDLST